MPPNNIRRINRNGTPPNEHRLPKRREMIELNTIYNEDCLETMKRMPDNFVDLIVTDPPYGIASVWKGGGGHGWGKARKEGVFRNKWDEKPPSKEIFDEMFRVSKNQIISWGGNYFVLPTSRCWLVWNKPERNFTLAEAELAWTSFDKVVRVKDCNRSDTDRKHPTQKPLKLMRWCISNYSEPTDIIYDPFMGSGTTARACKDLGRNFIGSEISKEYCDIAEQRLGQGVLL
jgi:site-specific DNA-methyltransferase (adenine-specific)